MADNHLQAKVEYQIQDVGERPAPRGVPDSARATSQTRWSSRSRVRPGSIPIELDKIVEQQKLERQLFTDPIVVTELLERYYREQGYLAAEIDEPRYEYPGRDGASGARRFGRARSSR